MFGKLALITLATIIVFVGILELAMPAQARHSRHCSMKKMKYHGKIIIRRQCGG